jgi:tartrate dehydrogenase/decarboxylase / D-malate dehydrogenase
MKAHRIAVIPGDGIGKETVPQGVSVLEAAGRKFGITFEWREFAWDCDYYVKHGRMMPEDWFDVLRPHDAIFYGAVGWPATVPDHVSLWGSLIQFRRSFDQYVNLRPCRLMPGIPTPLANRKPGDIDFVVVRENTEGEYSGAGGRVHTNLPHEVGLETSVFTRIGVERVVRFAFDLAERRRGVLTSATKSNASRYGYVLWDEIVETIAHEHPTVLVERVLVDALCARMVREPASLDVVVASNLFGDILTDLAAALQGGLGMAASGNIAPGQAVPGLFEPVHGSAPDIAGRQVANPCGAIWSAALMLDHLGHQEAAERLTQALEEVCRTGPRTRDVGGDASTGELGDAVVDHVLRGPR